WGDKTSVGIGGRIGGVNVDRAIDDGGGIVALTAGGAITDGNGSSTNVHAGNLTATAATGIALDLDVGQLTAALTGNGPITLTDTGTAVQFVNLNAGTGTITLDGGTFVPFLAGSVGAGSTLNVAGATLELQTDLNVTSFQLNGGSVISNLPGPSLSSSNSFNLRSGDVTVDLAGTGNLMKTTAGTVRLAGNNTYTGPTTVNA